MRGVNNITVIWNDVPTTVSNGVYSSSLKAITSQCSNSAINYTTPLNVVTRSLAQSVVGPISLNGTVFNGQVPFGDNAQLTLTVPQVRLPYPSSVSNVDYAGACEWTLPNGWTASGISQTGSGSYITYGTSIQVNPTLTGGGTVAVRALDTYCTSRAPSGQISYVSKTPYFSLPVTRPTPPLLIISNRTPQGGTISLFCGEQLSKEQVRPGSQPAIGEFSNYQFSSTSPVYGFCCLSSPTPRFTTSPGTGTIGLTARYTRNGMSTTATAVPVQVVMSPNVTPVTLKPIPASCPGQTIRLSVDPVPGAAQYAWTVPSPFSPQGVTLTTVPYLDVTSDLAALSRAFTIRVEARNGSCTPSADEKNGILGTGSGISIVTDASRSETEICAYTDIALQVGINDNKYNAGTTYYYDWNINKRNGSTGATTTYTDSESTVYVTTPGVGDWLDVILRVSSSCGNFLPASSSWQSVYRFQNGEYCLQSRALPGKDTPAVAAYPNPADEWLLLPTVAGTYTRYNSHGKAVRQPTPPPRRGGRIRYAELAGGPLLPHPPGSEWAGGAPSHSGAALEFTRFRWEQVPAAETWSLPTTQTPLQPHGWRGV